MAMQTYNGNYTHRNTRNRKDNIFYKIAEHDTVHTTYHRIKCGEECKNDSINMWYILGRHMEGEIGLHRAPGNENFHKLSKPHKTVSQESKTSEQCENNYADMRGIHFPVCSETR